MSLFDLQHVTITSDSWSVEVKYESWNSAIKKLKKDKNDFVIELNETGEWDSILKIDVSNNQSKRTCFITGINGGIYLYKNTTDSEGQTVKIEGDNLIFSVGINFISINLNTFKLNWMLEPDLAEVFEFYTLEDDFLLRGEIGIHRINKSGIIKWTFSASDIWVNIEGQKEVEIKEETIHLIDFNADHFEIDFNGNEIKKARYK